MSYIHFNYKSIAKKQKAQSVHRENWFISSLLIFVAGYLYVNLIRLCTWLSYNDYRYSAGGDGIFNSMA